MVSAPPSDGVLVDAHDQLGSRARLGDGGLHTFKEELTGPEYAGRFIEQVKKLDIPYKLNTMEPRMTTFRPGI